MVCVIALFIKFLYLTYGYVHVILTPTKFILISNNRENFIVLL